MRRVASVQFSAPHVDIRFEKLQMSHEIVMFVPSRTITVRARYSMLTWCTMPVPGGTTLKSSKAPWPQRRNWWRSPLREYSISTLRSKASGRAEDVGNHRVVDDQLGRL